MRELCVRWGWCIFQFGWVPGFGEKFRNVSRFWNESQEALKRHSRARNHGYLGLICAKNATKIEVHQIRFSSRRTR